MKIAGKMRDLTEGEQAIVLEIAKEMAELQNSLHAKQVEMQRVLRAMEPRFADDDVVFRDMAFWDELANTMPVPEIQGSERAQQNEG